MANIYSMKSFWEATLDIPEKHYSSLNKDIERDIVVIGGGLAGMLTAFNLTKNGFKVTLVEANKLYSGVTSKTTAHITAQQGTIFSSLNLRDAKLYYESQKQALDFYKELIESENIDCDFRLLADYNYTIKNLKNLQKTYKILKNIGADVRFSEQTSMLGFPVSGVIEAPNQASFHPLKFLAQLAKNFEIFENTRILKIDMDKKVLYTKNFKIKADKIVIATNYPIVKLKGAYFIKLYKSHSYCVSTEGFNDLDGTYQSDTENGFTFRSCENKLIIGGLDHRTGRVDSITKKQKLDEIAKKYFNLKTKYFWDANDVVTYDGLPIIGHFSKKHNAVYIITGFNKWGMTNSMASALLVTDLISGKANKFEKLFSPQRFNFSLGAFLINIGVSLKNLLGKPALPPLTSYKTLKVGEGDIVNYKGSKKAVYRDKDNNFHVCSPYCKHLGCQLAFNKNTVTWDCPCHGSRYDIDGNIITAPTVETLDHIVK